MNAMTVQDTSNALKRLAKDPNYVYCLQTSELARQALPEDKRAPLSKVNEAFLYLSENDPTFALKYILEPFVIAFGKFCKTQLPMKKWPTVNEVVAMFKMLNDGRLSQRFIEKRTRKYTIRKLIADIPDWNSDISKGVRKLKDRVDYFINVEPLFVDFVQNTYLNEEDPKFSLLREFCIFAMSEIDPSKKDLENVMVEHLIRKFKNIHA